jgi:hypothetical protein
LLADAGGGINSPTAITLQSLTTSSSTMVMPFMLSLVVAVLFTFSISLLHIRRRTF